MEFAEHLRKAMDDNNVSARKLARDWHPENPEGYRRSVVRYLSGKVTPTTEIRNQLAEALGVAPSVLPLGETMNEALMAELLSTIARLERKVDSMSHDRTAA